MYIVYNNTTVTPATFTDLRTSKEYVDALKAAPSITCVVIIFQATDRQETRLSYLWRRDE